MTFAIAPMECPERLEIEVQHTLGAEKEKAGEFWEEKTIEQLIAEQGTKPLKSIAELAGIWPEETA